MSDAFTQFQEAKGRRAELDKKLGKAEGRLEAARERKKEVTDELRERDITSNKELKEQIKLSKKNFDDSVEHLEELLSDAESLLESEEGEDVD